MKKLLILSVTLFITITVVGQRKAKVKKVSGIEVYILSEPVREYEIVNSGNKGVQWTSFVTGGLINESISTKVSKYVRKLAKTLTEQKIEFDAVIYSNGKNMSAIKFTDVATKETQGIATVDKIEGIPFFVMSEPLKEYVFIKTVGGGIKWKSAFTAGLLNNSIEQDLVKFAKKMKNKFQKNQINAIIYERGKKANAVKII